MAIKDAVAYLNRGEISDFLPVGREWINRHFGKSGSHQRTQNDVAKKEAFENRMMNNKRQIVFYEWLAIANARPASNLRKGRGAVVAVVSAANSLRPIDGPIT